MNIAHIPDPSDSLFTLQEMGVTASEWDEIQVQIRDKLFLHNAFFFPGNTPSLKNNKEILQIYNNKSKCCGAAVVRYKAGTKLIATCAQCKKPVNLKRTILGSSKAVQDYKKEYSVYFLKNHPRFIMEIKKYSKPYIMGFYFIRDSKRHFDYINAKQIILDMMVSNGYMEDDDADNIIDVSLGYHVDPKKAGCYLLLIPNTFFREIIRIL